MNTGAKRLAPPHRSPARLVSPLRYPGSKRRLAGLVKEIFALNDVRPELVVEPFAGGASVALQLMADGYVGGVGFADRDPLIAAFWKAVFFDTDWLTGQIETIEISVDRWKQFKLLEPADDRDRALKCLFLNRTSFSGILAPSAGPIGGMQQKSAYKIDCRFPRATLIRRIEQIARLADKVAFVWNLSWVRTLSLVAQMAAAGTLPVSTAFYFDPPFFDKADRLYSYYFKNTEHRRFRDHVTRLHEPWIMSYDSADKAEQLYHQGAANGSTIHSLYSATGSTGLTRSTEVILTNLERVPAPEIRVWRSAGEWRPQLR